MTKDEYHELKNELDSVESMAGAIKVYEWVLRQPNGMVFLCGNLEVVGLDKLSHDRESVIVEIERQHLVPAVGLLDVFFYTRIEMAHDGIWDLHTPEYDYVAWNDNFLVSQPEDIIMGRDVGVFAAEMIELGRESEEKGWSVSFDVWNEKARDESRKSWNKKLKEEAS